MYCTYKRSGWLPVLLCFGALFSAVVSAQTPEKSPEPRHLEQARNLVENLKGASENAYGGGKRHIEWEAGHAAARTVCSSFETLLLEHTYGWTNADFKEWMHSTNPEAEAYHDAIVERHGFERILHIDKLHPGDILAVKYTDHHVSKNGVEDTGHVMLVAEEPRPAPDKKPRVSGLRQYTVDIIDSSASGHGSKDTRARPEGGFTGGIGQGTLRLYVNESGRIVGYAWSTSEKSEYFTAPDRDIVAGRLTRAKTGGESEVKHIN